MSDLTERAILDELWEKGYATGERAGYAAGASAMRERAAKVCDAGVVANLYVSNAAMSAAATCADHIRALPLTEDK